MDIAFINRLLSPARLGGFAFRVGPDNLNVRIEQLGIREAMYPPLIGSQLILQPLFVWLFWDYASHGFLLLWLACFYALHATEVVHWFAHKNKLRTIRECRNLHLHFTLFAFSAGIMWGAAAVLFFPADIGYQGLMICIMLGLVAGAVTMNPIHPPSLYVYVFGIMFPLIGRVVVINDFIHSILAIMLVVFLLVVLVAGRELNKTFMLSLTQRFENIELLQQLTAHKAEIEEARRKLELTNNELRNNESKLEQKVQMRTAELLQRTQENELIKDTTIVALSSLAETRDNETGNHIRRTQNYIRALATKLKAHPRFNDFLTDENITLLYKIAPLHDVGKVGIPDNILHKPGRLTEEEFEIMKTHAALGGNAFASAVAGLDISSTFLEVACQIAMSHHEKWDGSGYPAGLSGESIPIPARLMALADVYDAMSCRRVYKSAIAHDEVTTVIVEGRGKHFDPDVVDAYLEIQHQFVEIAERYRD
ncbi:MAG: HD domain-containing protein [Sideroxyarcus sp.]|nr:HD domain-containing protein [Sideroxyarcus sp.]